MKTWFVSSLAAWLLIPALAWGARPQEGLACLEVGDLRCAQEVRDQVVAAGDTSEASMLLQMRSLFREGRYSEAVTILDALNAKGIQVEEYDSNPYRASASAARGLVSVREAGVEVRYAPGVERILRDDAVDVLLSSRRVYDKLFGGGPDHDVLLDIFPTAGRFIQASGLPPEAVRTTGVVALSKWSRLLLSSPRALSRGYGWKDTVAHEYIHLVVSWSSADRTPVWLQEGLAKHLESRWRTDDGAALTVHQQTLLAKALRDETFVPFEKFRHSMAYLDSGEEAALAFAQVATLVQHVLESGGEETLPIIIRRIRDGEEPELVVAEAAGYTDFDALMVGWRSWVAQLPLVSEKVAALPVVLDGDADEFASDPLLAVDGSKLRSARLGDLLRERDRPLAALVEYRKAADGDGPTSPMLMAREADCLSKLKRMDEALALVNEGVDLYPEFTLLQVTRGRLLDAIGVHGSAVEAWKAAHDLNPFDVEVQQALVDDFGLLGKGADAARHKEYLHILKTGGADRAAR
ncbi:MAG: hypothetical protein CL930_15330 [Deltaproteobacteria bacterium]|nr:hypothetical protein [Deltaproteobacteria bacterium]